MKYAVFSAVGLALAATTFTAPADAGPFDKIRSKVKKVERDVKKVERDVKEVEDTARGAKDVVDSVRGKKGTRGRRSGSGPNTISGILRERDARLKTPSRNHAGRAGPAPAKYTDQISCANLAIGNAFVAKGGTYTFSQGISTQERGGLIDRVAVSPEKGCYFPGLGVGDVLYVEFDRKKYNRHDYKIQCVSYDGTEQQDNTSGPSVGGFKGKDVMLHTGNSLGYTPTASGSNSSRSGAYDKYLAGRGRAMETFAFGALHTDKAGTDFFCQWYNVDTGKSAVAFTYRRGPRGA